MQESAPQPEEPKPIPKALPEDVKLAAQKWPQIAGDMDMPYRAMLREARLSVQDDLLVLVFTQKVHYEYFNGGLCTEPLKEALKKHTGREVAFTVRCLAGGESFEKNYVDIVRNKINFEIEEER